MEALYVCLFSDGHIKVGRSVDPMSRIASHVARVSCLGVDLVDDYKTAHVDEIVRREAALIARCAESATERHKNEWFEGLNYEAVCKWADEAAYATIAIARENQDTGIAKAIAMWGSSSGLAQRLGNDFSRQNVEYWRSVGRVPMAQCAPIALATGIPMEQLNPLYNWAAMRAALALSA